MECPMEISVGFAWWRNIIPYDVLSSSTTFWLKTRILAIKICPFEQMDLLETRMSIWHLACPVDPLDKWNVQWTFQLYLHWGNIIPYDELASSTTCWSETSVLAIGICPMDPMDPLDTRLSIRHFTFPVDLMDEWNVQWTNEMSNGHFDCVCRGGIQYLMTFNLVYRMLVRG